MHVHVYMLHVLQLVKLVIVGVYIQVYMYVVFSVHTYMYSHVQTAVVWDVQTGEVKQQFSLHKGELYIDCQMEWAT